MCHNLFSSSFSGPLFFSLHLSSRHRTSAWRNRSVNSSAKTPRDRCRNGGRKKASPCIHGADISPKTSPSKVLKTMEMANSFFVRLSQLVSRRLYIPHIFKAKHSGGTSLVNPVSTINREAELLRRHQSRDLGSWMRQITPDFDLQGVPPSRDPAL